MMIKNFSKIKETGMCYDVKFLLFNTNLLKLINITGVTNKVLSLRPRTNFPTVAQLFLYSTHTMGLLTIFYFTIYRIWSSIVIVREKRVVFCFFFFCFFFSKYQKKGWNYFDKKKKKKLGETMEFRYTKKGLISEYRKNYIFRDNNCFVKMSVSLLVCVI